MYCQLKRIGAVLVVACAATSTAAAEHPRFKAYIDAEGRLQLGQNPRQATPARRPAFRGLRSPASHLPSPAIREHIEHAALLHGLDPALLHAIVEVESAYDPAAVSPQGAVGLMQLMPATARRFGVRDRYDVQQNLRGGAGYLAWLLDHFQHDVRLAVAAYNAGEGAVRRAGNNVPPFAETQAYVRRVERLYPWPNR